jgi:acyl-CoA ligase (AMP-forming) (exosortase A-associated)
MTLLHELLDSTTAHAANRPALRYRGRDTSYAELCERSRRLATSLASAGVGRGARVVTYLQNRPAVVEVAFACSRLGAIFVPANPALRVRQLEHILRDSGAQVLVTSLIRDELPARDLQLLHVICDQPEGAAPRRVKDAVSYDDLFGAAAWTAPPPVIDHDAAAILYTSGSTGMPKGVILSHRNLVSGARSVASYLQNTAEDRILAALPLSFDYGLSQVTTATSVGACAVLTSFSLAGALVQEIAAERITSLAGVPTMWSHLANCEWPPGSASTLRYITNSGGALAPALLRALRTRLPEAALYCMYGLTEAFRSTYLDPAQLAARPGSIGKAIPNQEVLVLRADGTRCLPREVGELVHRGSLVTLGYWNAPELTAQRFRPIRVLGDMVREEIAVWSGDQVYADADGYLYFVGRTDALIKTSGYRISPNEIEEVVVEVPGVLEVSAVGLPDAVLGHRVAVGLVSKSPADSQRLVERVHQHCRMQLPAYMVPGEIRVFDAIPRNPNGKHDRAALAELFLGLVDAPAAARQ